MNEDRRILTQTRSLEEIRAMLRATIPELRRDYGLTSIELFGSYVRGEQDGESDLDVLVEFDPEGELSLFDMDGREQELLGPDRHPRRPGREAVDQARPPGPHPARGRPAMRGPRTVAVYLEDMLEATEKFLAFTRGLDRDDFLGNEEKVLAVTRLLEIIGEAAKNVPDAVRAGHPDVP